MLMDARAAIAHVELQQATREGRLTVLLAQPNDTRWRGRARNSVDAFLVALALRSDKHPCLTCGRVLATAADVGAVLIVQRRGSGGPLGGASAVCARCYADKTNRELGNAALRLLQATVLATARWDDDA